MNKFFNLFICLILAVPTVFASNYYVSPSGNDSNAGTKELPFATISKAVSLISAGDTCFLMEGRYYEEVDLSNLQGNTNERIVITKYRNDKVVLHGTIPVDQGWELHENGIFKKHLAEDVWALWLNDDMQTLARWPDSEVWSEQFWNQSQSWSYTSSTTNGLLVDPALAGINLDLSGSVIVMNSMNWKSRAGIVTDHIPGETQLNYTELGDYQTKNAKPYFLTGFALLDQPGEWFYDSEKDTLYYFPIDGENPNGKNLTAKNQSFCFTNYFGSADYLTIEGFTFFGTTVNLTNCQSLHIKNCDFLFPASSQRTLGIITDSKYTNLNDCDSLWVYNCSFQKSDGKSLICTGATNPVIENAHFYMIDYACLASNSNSYTVHMDKNLSPVFRYNTIEYAGASEGLRVAGTAGEGLIAEYNFHTRCGLMQTDGASIQIPPGNGPADAFVRYNWFINNRRTGQRFDGDPAGVHGHVYRNVAAHGGRRGFRLKGDYHEIYNNLAIDAEEDLNISKNKGPGPNGESNIHSKLKNNLAQNVDLQDNFVHDSVNLANWDGINNSQTVRSYLVDATNFDFRPKELSPFVDQGVQVSGVHLADGDNRPLNDIALDFVGDAPDIGAYEYGDSVYSIPGRRYEYATFPIPPTNSVKSVYCVDLMWREALNCEFYHVYFGTDSIEISIAGTSDATFKGVTNNNLFAPGYLHIGEYFWRVDAVLPGGEIVKGEVWKFTQSVETNIPKDTVLFKIYGDKYGKLEVLENATIEVSYKKEITDSSGTAKIIMDRGNYLVRIKSKGYLPKEFQLNIDSSFTELSDTLQIGSFQLKLNAYDGQTRAPVTGATLIQNGNQYKSQGNTFKLDSLAYDSLPFQLINSGYYTLDTTIFIPEDLTLDILLWPIEHQVTFQVSDSLGIPWEGANFTVGKHSDFLSANGIVNWNLREGKYELILSKVNDIFFIDSIEIVNNDTVKILQNKNRGLIAYYIYENDIPVYDGYVKLGDSVKYTDNNGLAEFSNVSLLKQFELRISALENDTMDYQVIYTSDSTITYNISQSSAAFNIFNSVKIWPNPVDDFLHIDNIPLGSKIRLFDANGKLINEYSPEDTSRQIDVSFLKEGYYIIEISTNSNWSNNLFIKK